MNQTVLITGASSGIGAELVKIFAAEGCNLVLVARSEERLNQLAVELQKNAPIRATILAKDLSKPFAAEEIFTALQAQNISVDILVNSAGYGTHGRFDRLDLGEELAMLDVNVLSLVKLTRLFLPGMVVRGYGRILNLGSTGSFSPTPLMASYGGSKAFVLFFSEALSEELKGTGVTVTALCPGVTRSGFQERSNITGIRLLRGPVMTPQEVAQTGYQSLMRGQAVVIPGLFNWMISFLVRVFPRSLVRWASFQSLKSDLPSKNKPAMR
ncbi:MAG TPA: SDR family oxidoreductase [Anaerolineaceae bacterium]|nr:SDR family oxidoreductase [Anaerolineaceae bacterium]